MTVPKSLLVQPTDDSGAETADRYDWQALTAAADYLAAIANYTAGDLHSPTHVRIICEHHEDFVLCIDAEVQLVSVKHRELSRGNWTFAPLFTDGGIAHLFGRWFALGCTSKVRIITNADLGNGKPSYLRRLCKYFEEFPVGPHTADRWELLVHAAERILNALSADFNADGWIDEDKSPNPNFLERVQRFLSVLTFDCGRPTRDILPSAAVSMYAMPFLAMIGHPTELAFSLWEAVSNLFRQRMRGRSSPSDGSFQAIINNIRNLNDEELLALKVRDRMVTKTDLIDVLKVVQQIGIKPLDRYLPPAPTRLALKLINAGCRETTVHAAEAVARRWREYENEIVLQGIGVSANLQKIKTRALLVAADVHESAANSAQATDYGPQMWSALRTSLSEVENMDPILAIDEDLALGLVCDLASQCQVWFSEHFNLDQALKEFPGRVAITGHTGGE